MAPVTYPQPGQFGLVRIPGTPGKLISIGQRLVGSGSYFTHAFLVIDGDRVIQGEPGGAKAYSVADAVAGRRVVYSDLRLTVRQRLEIVLAGRALIGTPYSYLDYLAIAAARATGINAVERYVGDTGHMICSQLVDEAYRRAGVELFPGRIPGDVAPGDLARLIGA